MGADVRSVSVFGDVMTIGATGDDEGRRGDAAERASCGGGWGWERSWGKAGHKGDGL